MENELCSGMRETGLVGLSMSPPVVLVCMATLSCKPVTAMKICCS
ncbi:MAG: hypothetical protein V3U57_03080 [Robiginitomaculum sp.]